MYRMQPYFLAFFPWVTALFVIFGPLTLFQCFGEDFVGSLIAKVVFHPCQDASFASFRLPFAACICDCNLKCFKSLLIGFLGGLVCSLKLLGHWCLLFVIFFVLARGVAITMAPSLAPPKGFKFRRFFSRPDPNGASSSHVPPSDVDIPTLGDGDVQPTTPLVESSVKMYDNTR